MQNLNSFALSALLVTASNVLAFPVSLAGLNAIAVDQTNTGGCVTVPVLGVTGATVTASACRLAGTGQAIFQVINGQVSFVNQFGNVGEGHVMFRFDTPQTFSLDLPAVTASEIGSSILYGENQSSLMSVPIPKGVSSFSLPSASWTTFVIGARNTSSGGQVFLGPVQTLSPVPVNGVPEPDTVFLVSIAIATLAVMRKRVL